MDSLAQVLIDVKVARSRHWKTEKLISKPEFDDFAGSICRLYGWLDQHSIADIEKIRFQERRLNSTHLRASKPSSRQ